MQLPDCWWYRLKPLVPLEHRFVNEGVTKAVTPLVTGSIADAHELFEVILIGKHLAACAPLVDLGGVLPCFMDVDSEIPFFNRLWVVVQDFIFVGVPVDSDC